MIKNTITAEQTEEIVEARKSNKNKCIERRLKAILLHSEGMAHKEIAVITEYAERYITILVSKYCRNGIESIVGNHYKGNHRNLSYEEEEKLLEEFRAESESGQVIETRKIKEAYEKKTGKSLDKNKGQIYNVLKRHEWRKVMPRSKHPNKASDEEIDSSKKLTLN